MSEFYDWQKDAYFVGVVSSGEPLGAADGVRQPLPLDMGDETAIDAYLTTIGMWKMVDDLAVQNPVRGRELINQMDKELMARFGPEIGRIIFLHTRRDVDEANKLGMPGPGTLDM